MLRAESYFRLTRAEQSDLLLAASAQLGRPSALVEKDIWVVWTLGALFAMPEGAYLVFKGGTSLSKAHGLIKRFSEDVDVTYDVRRLSPTLEQHPERWLPANCSQADKIAGEVRTMLPRWVADACMPALERQLTEDELSATITAVDGGMSVEIMYDAVAAHPGYVRPAVLIEFGARSTGEPAAVMPVACDAAAVVPSVEFPTANPRVMTAERTWWEKATAAHVYCLNGKMRGERLARHWYDLFVLGGRDRRHDEEHAPHHHVGTAAMADRALGREVARHKNMMFAENDSHGGKIDYLLAVSGKLQLVPEGASRAVLEADYGRMLGSGLLPSDAPDFAQLMRGCAEIARLANDVATEDQAV